MKYWIIRKWRYIWQLECGQEWKLGDKRHRRSVSELEQRSPSLLVRIFALPKFLPIAHYFNGVAILILTLPCPGGMGAKPYMSSTIMGFPSYW